MEKIYRKIGNWGNYPTIMAEINTPRDADEARAYLQSDRSSLIARGNGRCYGDAALNERVLSTLQLHRIVSFDAERGAIDCEAGVLLSDILRLVVPQGWFFHVTPGIKSITVGGAVASDVHGKNHPTKGCFSRWLLDFDLLNEHGELTRCSPTENAALFWQTCGGMGWTGIVLRARFQLMPIASTRMRQTTVRARDLQALFRAFEDNSDATYAAAWTDCLAGGASFGRGAAYFAEHEPGRPGESPVFQPRAGVRIPFFAPSFLLNPYSIALYNESVYRRARPGEQTADIDAYFYPLDRLGDWNKLYGRRGFVQYQFCVPLQTSFDALVKVLERIRKGRDLPFLSVMKRHGPRPPEAVHSFPIEGYSLALDFPRTRSVFDLTRDLDDIVWDAGGKIYLTKDACSAPRMGRVDPNTFGAARFDSLLKRRVEGRATM